MSDVGTSDRRGARELSGPRPRRTPRATRWVVVRHVATDGAETSLTWRELDQRSDALALELREQGLGFGDRLGMAMPNSLHLVLATVAAWKLGAIPVPVRWDLPDWERDRLRETVDAAVYLDESDISSIDRWIDERMAAGNDSSADPPPIWPPIWPMSCRRR